MIMAGDMCLLIPNRPLTFADKMCQLRRRPALPRCLFGAPDPVHTEKLLQEQIQKERDRFHRRWNINLDALEAAIERSKKNESTAHDQATEESRIPPTPTEIEERLSTAPLQHADKTTKSSSGFVPTLKKAALCKKPASKFQKRVRVAGSYKRQTYLTDFWRARRSLAFVFSKSKVRSVSLQNVTDLLEAPAE